MVSLIKIGNLLNYIYAAFILLNLITVLDLIKIGLFPKKELTAFVAKIAEFDTWVDRAQLFFHFGWYFYMGLVLALLARMYCRVKIHSGETTSFTPGYTFFIWIMPLVNIVRPYQALKEMYHWCRGFISGLSGVLFKPKIEILGFWLFWILIRIIYWITRGAYKASSEPAALVKVNVLVAICMAIEIYALLSFAALLAQIREYLIIATAHRARNTRS